MIRLLAFGCDRTAFRSRRSSLEAAGIQAVGAETEPSAHARLRARRFDVVTIGAGVSLEERNRLALVAKSRHKARIIFLYRGSVFKAELADALLSADVSTEDLISTIERLAGKAGKARAWQSAG